jgi:hypothetical protein
MVTCFAVGQYMLSPTQVVGPRCSVFVFALLPTAHCAVLVNASWVESMGVTISSYVT